MQDEPHDEPDNSPQPQHQSPEIGVISGDTRVPPTPIARINARLVWQHHALGAARGARRGVEAINTRQARCITMSIPWLMPLVQSRLYSLPLHKTGRRVPTGRVLGSLLLPLVGAAVWTWLRRSWARDLYCG